MILMACGLSVAGNIKVGAVFLETNSSFFEMYIDVYMYEIL